MQISMRSVRVDDFEWLYQLKKESYRDIVIRQFGCWDEELQRKMFVEKWHLASPAKIVVNGTAEVGIIVIEQRVHYDWLGEIQIKAEYREHGLGTFIIQRYVGHARSRGRPLRLQVLRENRRAKLLYKRLGFIQIESLENHYVLEIN